MTADALVGLRANPGFQRGFGIEDPCAGHFVTKAGRAMAVLAQAIDPVYVPFSLARYRYLAERVRAAAGRYRQLLRLGVGFDARPHWDAIVREASWQIYDVDRAPKLAHRERVLRAAGWSHPDRLHEVGSDPTGPELVSRLDRAGYRSGQATLAVMEGVSFFLPADTLRRVLAPDGLGLGKGSALLFDAWTGARLRTMNRRLTARLGRGRFSEASLGDGPLELAASLRNLGYTTVDVHTLAMLTEDYHLDYADDDVPDSWFVVEAHIDS